VEAATSRRSLAARVPWEKVRVLLSHPLVERIEAYWRPLPTLNLSNPEVDASDGAWLYDDDGGLPLRGAGVVIADIDFGIDVFHPAFFKDNGPTYDWVDNGNSTFDRGVDCVDLNGNSKCDAGELLDFVDGHGGPTGAMCVFEANIDWLFNDADADAVRDEADDSITTFGEQLFFVNDANENNALDVGETLRALGESKILKTRNSGGIVRTRGVDLTLTDTDTGGHGTAVAGIAVGEAPGRLLAGIAPDAEYLLGNVSGGSFAAMQWAGVEGADVVLHEFGQWLLEFLDGSSIYEQEMDAQSASGIAQVAPAGNLANRNKHSQFTVAGGGSETSTFTVPSGQIAIYVTYLWRTPSNVLRMRITPPSAPHQSGDLPMNLGWTKTIVGGYDVTAFYNANGPGTYRIQLEELGDCGTSTFSATLTGTVLDINSQTQVANQDTDLDAMNEILESDLTPGTTLTPAISATLSYILSHDGGAANVTDCTEITLIAPTGLATTTLKPFGEVDAHHTVWTRKETSSRGTVKVDFQVDRGGSPNNVDAGSWAIEIFNDAASGELVDGYVDDYTVSWSGGTVFTNFTTSARTVTWPATADSAVTVASYSTRGVLGPLYGYGGRGTRVDGASILDVAAPGDSLDVYTARSKNQTSSCFDPCVTCESPCLAIPCPVWGRHKPFSATSASVPHAAAAAAILKQYIPALTPAQIRTAIQDGALEDANTGATPNDNWGHGKLRILQALKEADRTPPAWDATVGAQSVVTSCGGATVSWNPATDFYKNPVQYHVYRDTVSGFTPGPASLIATTDLTSYPDSVAAGTYYYVVRAEDSAIEPNEDTNTVELSAVVVDAPPVAVGATLTVDDAGGGSVDLSWGASPDAGDYTIYRGTDPSSLSLLTSSVPPTHTDTPPAAPIYYYRTKAQNACGEQIGEI
jgi:hypothetical protein